MKFIVLLGRILFASLFILASLGHFSHQSMGYATSMGVPMASVLVPLSGIIAFLGGVSVLVGYKARLGAWLLVVFLIPVTFMMHKFWEAKDPMMVSLQQVMFMKNLALLGAAFV